jgi:DNA-binding transcriptional LysR family regulator
MFERLFARRGLSMDRLRVLCEVAEAGSIARAAGSDPVRQSQFSRQLKELEDFFEIELTRRQGKGLVLTDAGKELVQIARESIGRLHDFQLRAGKRPLSFSIGGGDSLVQWLVLPRLAELQKNLPKINLRLQNLRTVEIINRLQELSLDFALVRREALTEPLASVPLGRMEYALFCPKSLLTGDTRAKLPQLLGKLPLAMQSGDGAFMRQFQDWALENSLDILIKLECDSFPQACRAACSGQFATILPTIARDDFPKVKFLELDVPFLNKKPRQICLAWNPRTLRLRSEAVEVSDVLKRALKLD